MSHKHRGFTLIELLIVVAIIGIIAAVAVPNLLMAVQRAKVNRTVADLRALAEAVTAFMVDHNEYPDDGGAFRDISWVLDNSELSEYYNGAVLDAWGKPFRYRTSDGRGAAMVKSFGSNKIHNSTTGDFVDPSTWVDAACTGLTFQETTEIAERGCDIVFLNGVLAEK
jgi:general secretion pathway protein G